MVKFLYRNWGLFAVIVLSYWAIEPLLKPGFFPIHDDTQAVRVFEMSRALRDGHFPVRWVKDLGYGYGYPLFNFYAPLSYYLGAIISLLGVDLLISTKLMMMVGIVLAPMGMYFLVRQIWGELPAAVAGLFYLYAPYRALDVYVRGAIGELWAMTFIPFAFYGILKISLEPKWRWVGVGALGFAGVILSHNLTAMIVAPALVVFAFFLVVVKRTERADEIDRTSRMLASLLLGLGLAAFYWLPALLEIDYTDLRSQLVVGEGGNYKDHFVCLRQFWDSPWGFAGSAPGCIDGMSFRVGKIHLLAGLFGGLGVLANFGKGERGRLFTAYMGLLFLLSIFMMTEYSGFIWELLPPLAFLQYPWRFLLLVVFALSTLSGVLVFVISRVFGRLEVLVLSLILIFVLLFYNIKLFKPQAIFPATQNDYISEENIKWTTSKISDEFMPKNFRKPGLKELVVSQRVEGAKILIDKTHEVVFEIESPAEEYIYINIAPFPAWKAFVNGEPVELMAKDDGYEMFAPEKGRFAVRLFFSSTTVERVGNMISLASLTLLLGLGFFGKRWREKN